MICDADNDDKDDSDDRVKNRKNKMLMTIMTTIITATTDIRCSHRRFSATESGLLCEANGRRGAELGKFGT